MASYRVSLFGCDISVETVSAVGEKICNNDCFIAVEWLGVIVGISGCRVLCCFVEPAGLRVSQGADTYVFSLLDELA